MALQNEREYVILPVDQTQDYKPQKTRLIKDDKKSPRGLIQRDAYARQRYYPYAAARFNAEELVAYAFARFNAATPDELAASADLAIERLRRFELEQAAGSFGVDGSGNVRQTSATVEEAE